MSSIYVLINIRHIYTTYTSWYIEDISCIYQEDIYVFMYISRRKCQTYKSRAMYMSSYIYEMYSSYMSSYIYMTYILHICLHIHTQHDTYTHDIHALTCTWRHQCLMYMKTYRFCGVSTISRLLKIIDLFCKKALKKGWYSAKETYNLKERTNRSHPIYTWRCACHRYMYDMYIARYVYVRHIRFHIYKTYMSWCICLTCTCVPQRMCHWDIRMWQWCDTLCNTLQHTLQHTALHSATHCKRHKCLDVCKTCMSLQHTLQHTATHICLDVCKTCMSLQHTLQHTATHYATHCNTYMSWCM